MILVMIATLCRLMAGSVGRAAWRWAGGGGSWDACEFGMPTVACRCAPLLPFPLPPLCCALR